MKYAFVQLTTRETGTLVSVNVDQISAIFRSPGQPSPGCEIRLAGSLSSLFVREQMSTILSRIEELGD